MKKIGIRIKNPLKLGKGIPKELPKIVTTTTKGEGMPIKATTKIKKGPSKTTMDITTPGDHFFPKVSKVVAEVAPAEGELKALKAALEDFNKKLDSLMEKYKK